MLIQYYIYDRKSGNCSDFYLTKEEAIRDLKNNITCLWTLKADVLECADDDNGNALWSHYLNVTGISAPYWAR